MKENQQLPIPEQDSGLPMPGQPQTPMAHLTEATLDVMEKQLVLRERMLRIVQKAVKPRFWKLFGNSAYLMGAGGYQVGAVLGIHFTFDDKEKLRKENGHYMWRVNVTATLGGRSQTAFGVCASDNNFFMRNKIQPPPEEVDEANVMKKAGENGVSRAVTALLGLRGMTKEDLFNMGINPDQTGGSIEFKKGSQGGDTKSQNQNNQDIKKNNEETDKVRAVFEEITAIGGEIDQMGLDVEDFWKRVTRWEVDGKIKREFTRDEAGAYIKESLEKYGNAKSVWPWRKNADAVSNEMKAELDGEIKGDVDNAK